MGRSQVGVALLLVVLCASAPIAGPVDWNAPRAKLVSDLKNQGPTSNNTINAVSDGGKYVVFHANSDYKFHLWLANTETGRLRRLTKSHNGAPLANKGPKHIYSSFSGGYAEITPDGRFVVFSSDYSNLVPADRNRASDVFVYDRVERHVALVSRNSDGDKANNHSWSPSISADGRFVAFESRATNLSPDNDDGVMDVYVRDRVTKTTTLVSTGSEGVGNRGSGLAGVSDDGNRVSFVSRATNLVENDTNRADDAFVRDIALGTTTRVSVKSDGGQMKPFVYDESASTYRDGAEELDISGDGEVVVFSSHANNLIPEDDNANVDIFVHEIETGLTERVSEPTGGGDAYRSEDVECGHNGQCFSFIENRDPSITSDGRFVYFISGAPLITNEDDDDHGTDEDVIVHDRVTGETILVSRKPDKKPAMSANFYPGTIAAGGGWVTYSANGKSIDGPKGDQDPNSDVFLQKLPD